MKTETLTLLALDTATTGCSVCVWRDGRVLAAEAQPMARGQAQDLMPMVDRVLIKAQVQPQALSAIAVTRGPGAFTGLRIALAAARGFALALGVPCLGVTTLDAVAHGVGESERTGRTVLACVDSKRDDIFVQLFSSALEPLSEPLACSGAPLAALFETDARVLLVGDAAARALDMLNAEHAPIDAVLSSADTLPDPRIVAERAAEMWRAGQPPEDYPVVQPLYLRPPDAKLPQGEGRLRIDAPTERTP